MLVLLAMVTQAGGQKASPRSALSTPTGPEKGAVGQKPEVPLYISASRLEADQDQRRVLFKGQVKAVYGDAILYADELLVFYRPKGEGRSPAAGKTQPLSPLADLGGETIDRIEARGKVRLVQGDRVATGARAVYYRDKDEIVLLGQPQVWRGENHLRGSKITIYLASRKVVVQGSSQRRVEAHLYQGAEGGQLPKDLLPGGPKADQRSDRSR
jgi:lipopolysaccharide export system protein LptA